MHDLRRKDIALGRNALAKSSRKQLYHDLVENLPLSIFTKRRIKSKNGQAERLEFSLGNAEFVKTLKECRSDAPEPVDRKRPTLISSPRKTHESTARTTEGAGWRTNPGRGRETNLLENKTGDPSRYSRCQFVALTEKSSASRPCFWDRTPKKSKWNGRKKN